MTGWKDAVFLHGGMEGMERHGGFFATKPRKHKNKFSVLVLFRQAQHKFSG